MEPGRKNQPTTGFGTSQFFRSFEERRFKSDFDEKPERFGSLLFSLTPSLSLSLPPHPLILSRDDSALGKNLNNAYFPQHA